jgi:uncharacterized protein YciI
LLYQVVDDYVERRASVREAHLELARAALERGELVLGGAYGDPIEGAALVFRAADASVAEQFARHDPYVQGGLVTSWRVYPWTVAVGGSS